MKLNLVASYLLPNGEHFSAVHAIDRTNNLVSLNEMTSLTFPKAGGGFLRVAPSVLMVCPSALQARRCAEGWNAEDKTEGRLWHGEEIAECKGAKKGTVSEREVTK